MCAAERSAVEESPKRVTEKATRATESETPLETVEKASARFSTGQNDVLRQEPSQATTKTRIARLLRKGTARLRRHTINRNHDRNTEARTQGRIKPLNAQPDTRIPDTGLSASRHAGFLCGLERGLHFGVPGVEVLWAVILTPPIPIARFAPRTGIMCSRRFSNWSVGHARSVACVARSRCG